MSNVSVEHKIEKIVPATFGRGWTVLRLGLAVVILTAAALKAHQLATTPSLGEDLLHARWFNILVVEFELFFGIWLLFGLLTRLTWLATVGCFAIFTLVSLYKVVLGEASCGCWGVVEVDPKITAGFDLLVVILLITMRPIRGFRVNPFVASEFRGFSRVKVVSVVVLWIVTGTPAFWFAVSFQPAVLAESGELVGDSKMVVLEPERWIGHRFPLMPHLGKMASSQIEVGNWKVVLFHFDCEKCKHVVERASQEERVLLVEVPTEERNQTLFEVQGYVTLPRERHWWVETPVVVILTDGIVRQIANGLD